MTTAFERIKELADKQRISLNDLEDKLGISRNSLYGIKKLIQNQIDYNKLLTISTCPPTTFWDAQKILTLRKMVMLLHH